MESAINDLEPVPSSLAPLTGNRSQALAGMRILVVDDCEDNQFLVKTLLTRRGASVEIEDNGANGASRALKNQFDIVLMDIQMPDSDGYEGLKILKNSDYTLPVVALTASSGLEEKATIQNAGFAAYLTKPIDADHLVEVLRGLAHVR